jgi:endonuclease/exonuclease/phosphatase (EEP) superfamily protein YafD
LNSTYTPNMTNLFLYLLGATLAVWLFLWRKIGDKWGWLGLANAWAEWGAFLLAGVGLTALFRKEKGVGLSMIGTATLAALPQFMDSRSNRTIPPTLTDTAPFTVFSANLFKRNPSMARHLALIRTLQPDILCLQEFSPHFAQELLESVGDTYPYRALRPEKGSYGYGVLSRYPIEETGFWDRPGIKAWGQRVRVTLPTGKIVEIYNVHLFPPMADDAFVNGITWSFRAREAQIEVMQKEIAERGVPALIIGDCNFNDTSDAYRLAVQTLTDSWQVAGRGSRYTWPTLAFPSKRIPYNPRMLRLDYCFHNEQLTTQAFQIITERTGSDHTPLLATLAVSA